MDIVPEEAVQEQGGVHLSEQPTIRFAADEKAQEEMKQRHALQGEAMEVVSCDEVEPLPEHPTIQEEELVARNEAEALSRRLLNQTLILISDEMPADLAGSPDGLSNEKGAESVEPLRISSAATLSPASCDRQKYPATCL